MLRRKILLQFVFFFFALGLIVFFGNAAENYLKTENATEENANENITQYECDNDASQLLMQIGDERLGVHPWTSSQTDETIYFVPAGMERDLLSEEKVVFLSNIPTIYLDMNGDELEAIKASKDNKANAKVYLFEGDCLLSDGVSCVVKARGNASFNAPLEKKSYNIKLESNQNMVTGAEEGKEWVLLAHYYDDTHFRDMLTFDLAKNIGMKYVPAGMPVNVYMAGDFQGIYFLCEKIGIGENRIDIVDLEEKNEEKWTKRTLQKYPYALEGVIGGENRVIEKGIRSLGSIEDVSGGYLLELEYLDERFEEESSGFVTKRNLNVVIKSPQYATKDEVTYIRDYFQLFEEAVTADIENGTRTSMEYFDLDSFVQKYLVEEVSKNADANYSSQYIYKDSDAVDGKFYAGPVWDYDRTYDNKVSEENRGSEMFWVKEGRLGFDFWQRLYLVPGFEERVRDIYKARVSDTLSQYINQNIEDWSNRILDSVVADMIRYGYIYEDGLTPEERFNNEVSALRDFIEMRKSFLDREWIYNE